MDVVADEVTEKQLYRQQDAGEGESHAEHDVSFSVELSTQQVPCSGGGDAEGAGDV